MPHSPHPHLHCITQAMDTALKLCAMKKAVLTTSRKRVLELIWQSHRPVKAYDLLAALQQEDQAAKPPTIYRALDFLMSLGLIHKIHSLNAYLGCAHPAHPEEALLLICKDCEEVIEITSPTLTTTLSNIYQKQQFTPHTSVLEVMGQCRDCLT